MQKVNATKQQITDSVSGILNLMHSHLFSPMDLQYMQNVLGSLLAMVQDAIKQGTIVPDPSSFLSEKIGEKLKYPTDGDQQEANGHNRAIDH